MKEEKKVILEITKRLLELMAIEDANVEMVKERSSSAKAVEGKEEIWEVQIETAKTGILIGFHGETIAALQLLIGLMVYKKLGRWQPIVVNVGDYRQKRQLQLERMAQNAAQRVRFSGQAVALPYLSAGERRVVHLALAEDSEVETESEGEGRERQLVIRPKQSKN